MKNLILTIFLCFSLGVIGQTTLDFTSTSVFIDGKKVIATDDFNTFIFDFEREQIMHINYESKYKMYEIKGNIEIEERYVKIKTIDSNRDEYIFVLSSRNLAVFFDNVYIVFE